MSYLDLIKKALDEGKMLSCILGFDDYHIMPHDPSDYHYQDYDTLLNYFDEFEKKNPGSGLRQKYEDTVKFVLTQDAEWANTICEVSDCLLTQIRKEEFEDDFNFTLSNPREILTLASETIHNNKDALIENLSSRGIAGERRLAALERELSNSIVKKQ